ncbi:MAG: sugar phosphate isomerase/epimerase [Clostridia bacterium]|nr:sugar phosphate isomerase/epimerase [Clostridia bacterium]
MKVCFSTLGCTERSLAQVLALAKAYHMDGIEIRGLGGLLRNADIPELQPEYAPAVRSALRDAGLVPVVLGTSCQFHAGVRWDDVMTEGQASIRAAQRLGIPFIRVFGNYFRPDAATAVRRVIDGIRSLLNDTADTNVTVLLEIHADFHRAEELLAIVNGINSPRFGLLWDVYHSDATYGDDWMTLYRQICPYIRHVHIKDYHRTDGRLCLPGDGDLPLSPILRQLEADEFDGFVSLEWERLWHPELPEIEAALDAFRLVIDR